jgi:hypothetical protein
VCDLHMPDRDGPTVDRAAAATPAGVPVCHGPRFGACLPLAGSSCSTTGFVSRCRRIWPGAGRP